MTIEERVTKLEELAIRMIMPILASPNIPKYISVSAIYFKDENGISRGMIGMTDEGRIGVSLSDEKGEPHVVLNYGARPFGLIISDENNKVRVHISMSEHGPALLINKEEGKLSMMLIDSKAGPILRRFDKNGGEIPIF